MPNSFPKIIWQTHNHKKQWLPDHLNTIAATWVNLNPGWDYRYVDQVQRDEKVRQYPEIYEIYKYRLPVIQSDIWRFIVTYEEGGCYADMDSVCRKPLDYMIDNIQGDPEIITVPVYQNMGNTHNFIVKAKSPIMKMVVDKMIVKGIPSPTQPFGPWMTAPFKTFVDTVYSAPNVNKYFDAAHHSVEYKARFDYKKHIIEYYGQTMTYVDFITEKGLSLRI